MRRSKLSATRRLPRRFTRIPVEIIEEEPAKFGFGPSRAEDTTDPALSQRRDAASAANPRSFDRVQIARRSPDAVRRCTVRSRRIIRRGPIDGVERAGTLRLETGIGNVTCTDARLTPDGLLRLRAFNGDVRLTFAERARPTRASWRSRSTARSARTFRSR